MPRAARALLVAPVVVLAACGATSTATSAATSTAASPPATARMICSADIKGKVTQALRLDSPPPTHDRWAEGTYTCDYSLPMGTMRLSDQVFPDAGAARAHLASAQSHEATAHALAGLGQRAYGSDRGLAVVVKDDQVLTVDTSGLPERFGATGQRRSDLAYEVASDVLGCWTGDE